ncbi:helix-turn-helix domain-containing protein [Dyadobacter bucti]|uniref:helix-turn-helix domain-containing protein n=1 Tax=Dyadobacter bucti TaxID=2572203 RepID=UPI001E629EA1|nr:helix-turn-helix transcriptional regulator [Dyadobacter bucti]
MEVTAVTHARQAGFPAIGNVNNNFNSTIMNTISLIESPNPFAMQIMGTKVRKLRELFGYSQEYVAFHMNISQAAYSKKEAGRTELSLSCLTKIAAIYHVTIIDLITVSTKDLLLKVIQATSETHA